ncbi:MAG: hypothetical protein GXO07_02300 [Crenarchaeota archaeon]|nr:hypothetical protein [Thermoproteota archaeon]
MRKLAILTVLLVSAVAFAYTPAYPCTYCHTPWLKLDGNVKSAPIHKINLLEGAHAGLYCSNCHDPQDPIRLINGAIVVPRELASPEQMMQYNTLCATCHPRTYADYLIGAHGNTTFTCEGGKAYFVYGYKGSPYWYHDCPEYTNLQTVPGKPCTFCHNPHDPVKMAASIMPPPSDRPKPYPQDAILNSLFFLMALATVLSVVAYIKK